MEIFNLTNKPKKPFINKHLDNGKSVLIMSGQSNCINCEISKENINNLENDFGIVFCYVDNIEDFEIESDYYQMEELNEYPKSILYHYSGFIKFNEGVITEEKLKELLEL
jgi:glutaredoxin-related protein